jgi:parvulin-like peptidyl-prolyl isomerase
LFLSSIVAPLSTGYYAKSSEDDIELLRDYYCCYNLEEIPESIRPIVSEDEKNQVKARAEAILKRTKAGEDFAKVAQAYSEDQGSKAKGGDLGYFTLGRMVPEFEDAAFYTDPGEISGIVETQYGYHIIKVEDHINARQRSFEEMKDYIREKLHRQLVMFKVQKFIRQATESAGMRVYSDRIAGK